MTEHAGPPVVGDTAVYDQVRACHTEITEYMARRATVPLHYDVHLAIQDYTQALVDVYGILSRVNMIFLQLEQANA